MSSSKYLSKTTHRTKCTRKYRALGYYQSKTLANIKGDCPHYRSNTKVRYAKGFIGILDCIPHKQMQTVVAHLMGYLAVEPITAPVKENVTLPAEQQHILNILKNCGVTYPESLMHILKTMIGDIVF